MAFYLAVDAGGTKTTFVLGNESSVLARISTGTIKRMRTDASTAETNLIEGLLALTAQSGIVLSEVTRTCIGAAGFSVPLVADWLREQFALRVGGEMLLLEDVEIALDAGFFGDPGVLLLAGTGSNVAGRLADGRLTRAGGWGPALADQGSGHRIGYQALRAMFLARDEGIETLLWRRVLETWKLEDLGDIIGYANRIPPPDFSQLAKVVVACADEGDVVARGVLQREAEEIAHLAALIIRRVRASYSATGVDGDAWMPRVAFAGSILEHVPAVREGAIEALRSEFMQVEALEGVVDPVMGALWQARAGWSKISAAE